MPNDTACDVASVGNLVCRVLAMRDQGFRAFLARSCMFYHDNAACYGAYVYFFDTLLARNRNVDAID